MTGTPAERLRAAARDVFGWEELRPGQEEPMAALLAGRDVLLVAPTGAGKSAVYQVPGVLLPGPTLVVSPLRALQRDQAAALAERPGATGGEVVVDGALTGRARVDALARVAAGEVEFVFCGPEQLARDDVLDALRAARPSLVVVDEAHTESSWGHDFRPDYLRVGAVVQALGHPPVCALTATASPPVRAEVVERLGLVDPLLVVTGSDRPEVHLAVEHVSGGDAEKRALVVERVAGLPKPALVYVATRRETGEYAEELAGLGLAAAGYHGAAKAADREDVHRRWLADELDVVVATTAFGMGIDKPDVRTVVHADPPDSLDAYLQEVGRAARDGEPASALLVWRPEDLGVRRFFAGGLPREASLRAVAAAVAGAEGPLSPADVAAAAGVGRQQATRLLDLLEQVGTLRLDDDGRVVHRPDAPAAGEAARAARERAAERRRVDESRVEMVRAYAETPGCRRQLLLSALGEVLEHPCGNCDCCDAGLAEGDDVDQADSPYPVGGRVEHAEWGPGLVVRYEGDRVVVLFDAVGYRTLALDAVVARGLLQVADPDAAGDPLGSAGG